MATARSRRLEYSESTRQALVDSAIDLITKRGYAGTALDEISKRARVTKGALYHHFSGKQALFEAAFNAVESNAMRRLAEIVAEPQDPWAAAMTGLRTYIKICLEPSYQRIVVHEGPVVMGWERWREAEDHFSFGLIRDTVQSMIDSGAVEAVPVEVTSRLLFGALSAAATVIATASDQKQASVEVITAVERMLERIRLGHAMDVVGEAPSEAAAAHTKDIQDRTDHKGRRHSRRR
ncbi:MAG: TetR/AcrR family transcriptional regulator [Sciscionella sp.]